MKRYISFLMMLVFAGGVIAQDLASLHEKLIRFYGWQRSGLKSGGGGILNGKDVHGGDNLDNSPLDGGWNDAGDYIKFGMPLSYAVYCLLKGYDIFPSSYDDKYKADNSSGSDGIPDVLNQAKWATDYIQKAVISDKVVVLDVGIASEEHRSMDVVNSGGRSGGQIVKCDGGDIPAVYAADLALMSVLYKKFDANYSAACLAKAKLAFAFAKSKIDAKQQYCTPQLKDGAALYDYYDANDGKGKQRRIDDKMAAAGVELFRATGDGDPIYKTWAKRPIATYSNCLTYSFIGPLASFEVWRQGLGEPSSVTDNSGFVGLKIAKTGFFSGVYQNSGWGTARDVGTAAFVFALAYVVNPTQSQRDTLLNRAKNHVAWVTGNAGSTKRNYIVKWGSGGPSSIHYRPTSAGPEGGVVSGPDGDGAWANDGSAKYCEVALDYNAGIVGAVAFLRAVNSTGGTDVKVSNAFTATPGASVDFSKSSVTFSAGFSKSVACTVKISGGSGSKTLTASGTSLNLTWDGSADKGFFISGESVAAQLIVDGTIAAIDIVKAKALTISIAKAKKLQKGTNDVLIDDFDDGDKTNKIGGQWLGCGWAEGSFASQTVVAFDTMNGTKCLKATCNVPSDDPAVYAGVKSTFKADGGATSIGGAESILFDLKASKEANLRVELVQPSIADTAFWGVEIPVTTLPNTYRVNIEDFKQPSWKTADKPLDRSALTAFRFAVYDSTSNINLYLDNVYIESYNSAVASGVPARMQSSFKPVFTNGALHYRLPGGAFDLTIRDVVGRIVMQRSVDGSAGDAAAVSLSSLSPGMFIVEHSIGKARLGQKMKITLVR